MVDMGILVEKGFFSHFSKLGTIFFNQCLQVTLVQDQLVPSRFCCMHSIGTLSVIIHHHCLINISTCLSHVCSKGCNDSIKSYKICIVHGSLR